MIRRQELLGLTLLYPVVRSIEYDLVDLNSRRGAFDMADQASSHQYGSTTISDRATALLGSRYNFGDKFHINHATFVLKDAPDAQSLTFKSVAQWQRRGTPIERLGASTPVEDELQSSVRELETELARAREQLRAANIEKEKHQASARDLRVKLHRASMSSFAGSAAHSETRSSIGPRSSTGLLPKVEEDKVQLPDDNISEVDNTPYIRFSAEQTNRDEEVHGPRDNEDGYEVVTDEGDPDRHPTYAIPAAASEGAALTLGRYHDEDEQSTQSQVSSLPGSLPAYTASDEVAKHISQRRHESVLFGVEEIRNPAPFSADEAEEKASMSRSQEEEKLPDDVSIEPTDKELVNGSSQEPKFPHAFERWETLSSHWEGLTSYWIHRLKPNDDLSGEPLNKQMARQITDLSAAGSNLFHAVVELQRLRASSERKFQRWFFETRAEQEKSSETIAQLQTQLYDRSSPAGPAFWEQTFSDSASVVSVPTALSNYELRHQLNIMRFDIRDWSRTWTAEDLDSTLQLQQGFLRYANRFIAGADPLTEFPRRLRDVGKKIVHVLLEAFVAYEIFAAIFKHLTSHISYEAQIEASLIHFITRTGPAASMLKSEVLSATSENKSHALLSKIIRSALEIAAQLREEKRSVVVLDLEGMEQSKMRFDTHDPYTVPHALTKVDTDDDENNGRSVVAVIGPALLAFDKDTKHCLDIEASDVLIAASVFLGGHESVNDDTSIRESINMGEAELWYQHTDSREIVEDKTLAQESPTIPGPEQFKVIR